MKIVLSMPAYNEAEGIQSFIREIRDSLADFDLAVVVVDDCSKDQTSERVGLLADEGIAVEFLRNEENLGHGPSTLRAMRHALTLGPDAIITTDGDGQFLGTDIDRVAKVLTTGNFEIVEGVRTSRDDPRYRRLVSWTTRSLVGRRSGVRPMDANTPLRVYRPDTLRKIIELVPDDSMIPNLHISAISRASGCRIAQIQVKSIPRRGSDAQGSTWGKSRRELPSKRFVKFCLNSIKEWQRLSSLRQLQIGRDR